jgi:hypothetical protein
VTRNGLILGLALVGSLAACAEGAKTEGSGRARPSASSSGKVAEAAKKLDQAGKVLSDDRKPLSPEEYETLLVGLGKCDLKGAAIDPECPERKAWNDARTRANALKDLGGVSGSLGKKHIKHERPAVRIQAAALLGSIFGTDKSGQQTLLEAAKSEKEPAVLVAILETVGHEGKANPDVGKLLLAMADHEAPMVRKRAVIALGSGWNRGMAGAVEKLSDKIDKDPDIGVREMACLVSGNHGDDRLVAVYERLTQEPTKEPKLYAACMEGLFNSWMNYPLYETTNEKAYRLGLKRLGHTPRSEEVPPWTLMSNFKYLAKEDNRSLQEWKKRASWFKADELLKPLEGVVTDPKASSLARTGALESVVALGATKATLQRLQAKYKGSKELSDRSVMDALDKAAAAAK